MAELTQERLKELLHYGPNSGLFMWRVDRRGTAKAGQWAGRTNSKGYVEISVDGKRYKAHRLAWLYTHGVWPKGQIDHKDRDRAGNWIDNLRDVTQSVNLKNTGAQKNNTSGVKYLHKTTGGWRVSVDGQYSKLFKIFDEAKELAILVNKELSHG